MSAPMQWFRLYSRIVDDPKLKLLAFEDRWHFVALCCLKSNGLLDEPDSEMRSRKIAVSLGVQLRELDEISRRLREVELIDEHLHPLAWNDLQFRSDNSTDRVKKYREKQSRNAVQRVRNVSETVQETETESEKEIAPNGACASDDALTAQEIFDDWNALARECGLPTVRKLTDARRKAIRVRLREYPDIEDWRRAFAHIRNSPFLRGENKSGWQATFNFILQAKSFTNLTEESYGTAH